MGRLDPERIDAALIAELRIRAAAAASAARGPRCTDYVRAWTVGLEAVADKVEAGAACSERDSAMLKAFMLHTSPENILGFKDERSWHGVVPKGCELVSSSSASSSGDYDNYSAPCSDGAAATYASTQDLNSALRCPSAYIPFLLGRGDGGWGPAVDPFNVRGATYLSDAVKVESAPPLFYLRGVQLFRPNSEHVRHVAQQSWSAVHAHIAEDAVDDSEWFIVNYLIPGQEPIQAVCYFCAGREALELLHNLPTHPPAAPTTTTTAISTSSSNGASSSTGHASHHTVNGSNGCNGSNGRRASRSEDGWRAALRRFWFADQDYCDQRFKLIPRVVEGPWALQLAIGSKPVLTGTKVSQQYFRGNRYLEVDIDIGSSVVASNILALVNSSSSALVLDIGITVQGNAEDELPERMLCAVRWHSVHIATAPRQSFDR